MVSRLGSQLGGQLRSQLPRGGATAVFCAAQADGFDLVLQASEFLGFFAIILNRLSELRRLEKTDLDKL